MINDATGQRLVIISRRDKVVALHLEASDNTYECLTEAQAQFFLKSVGYFDTEVNE